MSREIKKAAVLGSGVMGAAIAAHLANAGIPSIMLDIVKPLSDEDKKKGVDASSKAYRNAIAQAGLDNALKARPAAFFTKKNASLVSVGNFEDDMAALADVDWIVEVVVERLDIKRKVFENVRKHWTPGTIISSNTSGIAIADMMETFDDDFKKHFLVTHFFNPVRYMNLLEIVSGPDTDPAIVDQMVKFGSDKLGKGIVFGKDTPNFIANRIGVYSIMKAMAVMQDLGMTINEVDMVAGPPMGRPKSACFRTADLVGLDTFKHVSDNVYEGVPDDDERDVFKIPDFMAKMVEKNMLGGKTKGGFYKKDGKDIKMIDYKTLEYVDQPDVKFASLDKAKKIKDLGARVKSIVEGDDNASKFAWLTMRDCLLYSAKLIPEIADDVVNVDNAMKWGFNWEMGPFETWDAIGVEESCKRMEAEGKTIPQKVKDVIANGGSFYKRDVDKASYFDFGSKSYKQIVPDPKCISLEVLKQTEKVVKKNAGARLIDMGDGVLLLEFNTKMNAIDDDIIGMMQQAIEIVPQNHLGLVIGNEGANFSVGANLFLLVMAAKQKQWDTIEKMSKALQDALTNLRYAPFPVVAAPHQMTLGGGCEVCMGVDMVQAAAESYVGLVEVGVGLIPGGGGCMQMVKRMLETIPDGVDVNLLAFMQKAFENIGMAKVATSAREAQDLGLFRKTDRVSVNRAHHLNDAKNLVIGLAKAGYEPGLPSADLPMLGRDAMGAFNYVLWTMQQGGYISEHDKYIASQLSNVIVGGDVSAGQKVSEQYLLDLERETFLRLCGHEKSIARMEFMLTNNKPLRN